MFEVHDQTSICAFAFKGHGKTTLLKNILKKRDRKIIIDPNNEHNKEEYEENGPVGICNSKMMLEKQIKYILEKDLKKYTLIVKFDYESVEDEEDFFNYICKRSWEMGDVCLHIEEAHNFVSPGKIPRFLKRVTSQSRHANMCYHLTNVTPLNIKKILISECDYICVGYLNEKGERDYFADKFPDVDAFKTLEKGEFLVFDVAKRKVFKMTNDLKIKADSETGALKAEEDIQPTSPVPISQKQKRGKNEKSLEVV